MDGSNASNAVSAPNEESSSSSLTLSITPPLSDAPRDESSTISEHLSSIENDRSVQEIEVTENFTLLLQNLPSEDERLSQEPKPPSLNSSFNSNSIISLNGLERFISTNMEGKSNAQSILEEILNNDQFRSGAGSKEESLDIFANVDLDDKLMNSYNLGKTNFNLSSLKGDSYDEVYKRIKDFEEIIAVKDSTIAALTSELDSFRELISNTSSNSLGTSTTEYKLYQEECHNKLVEYHNAVSHKDEQIEKLTQSLQQSILTREDMKQHFKNEIQQLQEQLEETSSLLKQHKCAQKPSEFDEICSKLERVLTPAQIGLFDELKLALREKNLGLEEEIAGLKSKIDSDKMENEAELARLRDLLSSVKDSSSEVLELKQELGVKHSKEMEELRTYFEKKCADLEKNYSEEVFSQQSRKLSGSSSCSEMELSSDFVFNQPGPGGDAKVEYSKKDMAKMHQALSQVLALMGNYNIDKLTDAEFEHLKSEIGKFELRNLLKYDLAVIRSELQNKYHAELEILREDFDNRVDILNVEHENKLRSLEKRYAEEVEDLNVQLRGRVAVTTQQEVANSGEFEIDEVVQSYERRLQEQVTLAKIDIIAALETQIQRLVACDNLDEDWPDELLQLKSRFCEKYQREMEQLRSQQELEIALLKEEHVKNLNGALERARRRSLRDADSLSKGEIELLKERDALKKQTLSLRNLLGELLKYFTQCEDELNNTLVEELISKNLEDLEASPRDSLNNVKRVHMTPNFNDLINLIDNSPENDLESIDLKSELGSCLEKLKSDANAILALTTNLNRNEERARVSSPKNLEREVTSLTRKLINETQIKNNLAEQLSEARSIVQSLESDRGTLENQLENLVERQKIVENDLLKAREKIAELIENGHREIVSEGYGEDGHKTVQGLAAAIALLAELQDRARNMVEAPGNLELNIVHLIEELARVGGKVAEEARRDHDDLKQQIEAADKKYKITCQFLEDQAAEREQERDEAQKEIDALKEHLKEREKDRASCERYTSEVENLELQLREMAKSAEAAERRCKEVENERKEAVDKIFELRDIIRDLEDQVRGKSSAEEELKSIIVELEGIVKVQSGDDLKRPDVSDIEHLQRYIGALEGEVQRLRLTSEIAGSEGAIQQIRNHLCEFETTLDKRTKDLEGLHSALSTTCSSPSEDMSIRDVVHQVHDECEVPLQQLARLKEKLLRHSRAEDAAVKRIRDLEMQILALKSDIEESQTEREMLKRQISDHLVLISNLQIRLDEQRIRAEHIEKQTTTSLEVQNYDLKNTIAALEENISKRDKHIAQLKNTVEETKRRLEDREKEISSNHEDEIIAQMQEQLEFLRSENLKLKTKIDKEAQMFPNLVENIISDKNSDIEVLRERLSQTEKQLELFTSLSLEKGEIETLNRLRLAGVSFKDMIDLEDLEQARRATNKSDSLVPSPIFAKKKREDTISLGEISTIEKVGPPNLFFSLQTPQQKANSTEKHVRFEDEVEETRINSKDEIIRDYEERLKRLKNLEEKVELLQTNLEETESCLKKATAAFELDQKRNAEEIEEIRQELAAKNSQLVQKQDELEACLRNLEEERSISLSKDKDLEALQKLESELKSAIASKDNEIRSHEETLKLQNEELKKLDDEIADLKRHLQENRDKDAKIAQFKIQVEDLSKELVHLQQLVAEKEKIIEQMGADSRSLHVNLETIQNKLQESGNVVDLGRRLREEQKKNSQLHEELHGLKAQLMGVDLDDIAGQVQRELDYSAYLDSTLINAVGDGSLENEDVEALKLSLKKQKSISRQLGKAKDLIEKKYEDLERAHEELKKELDSVQYEDAVLIGQLRTKLDNVADSQKVFDKILEASKHERSELEGRLKTMRHKMNSLPDFNNEKRGLEAKIQILEEENNKLRQEIRLGKAELVVKDEEVRKLETKLAEIAYSELSMKEKLSTLKTDLDNKTKELATTKSLMDEMKLERKKLSRLAEKPKSTDTIPDKLMEKISELKENVRDNMKMMELITRLNHEKGVLEERIQALEGPTANVPFDDPASRANYLFAKYLRSESYRKALAWQKRYLVSLLGTYQTGDVFIEVDATHLVRRPKRSAGLKRFKAVALMVVSVYRMKFLVRRWHSGKRIVQQRTLAQQKAQFQVGQPVSSQNFAPKSALTQPKSEMPWFGTSPPSKERKLHSVVQKKPDSGGARATQEALNSPAMLSKYIERFNQIQERLGLDSYH